MIGYGTVPRSLSKQIRSWRGRMATPPEIRLHAFPIYGRSSAMGGEPVFTPNPGQMKNQSFCTCYFTRRTDAMNL